MTEEQHASERCLMLAELLIEAEADLAATIGVPLEEIVPEAVQDAAIAAIQQAVDNIDRIDFRRPTDESTG